jgi:hypothetical protein
MNAFEWNGLRVGDPVILRELSSFGQAASLPGVVAFVEVRPVRRGGNNVGVRVVVDSERVTRWPSRGQLERQP